MTVFAQSSRIVLLAKLESLENTTQKKTAYKMWKIHPWKLKNTRESGSGK